MKAVLALDALVAEKVMGCQGVAVRRLWRFPYELETTIQPRVPGDGSPWEYSGEILSWDTGCAEPEKRFRAVPAYSTSIAAAWEVVEHLLLQGHDFTLDSGRNRETGAVFHSCRVDDVNLEYAPTAPLAICLATLKACGVEVPA